MAKPLSIVDFMKLFPNDSACLGRSVQDALRIRPRLHQVRKAQPLEEAGQTSPPIHARAAITSTRWSARPSTTPAPHLPESGSTPSTCSPPPATACPAKELQRQLSVNYKTAWRMGHEIRKYLAFIDGDDPLGGEVEIDETRVGGRRSDGRGSWRRKARPSCLAWWSEAARSSRASCRT